MNKKKPNPTSGKLILDESSISKAISRIAYEILEQEKDVAKLAIVGIRTGGEFLSVRIREKIEEIEKIKIPLGVLDITLYRDDLNQAENHPVLRGTDLPFRVTGSRIVLVDDVLFTGRTIRAALDAVTDFGRPYKVELATLVDRGHRELPIRPDYVGKNIPTNKEDSVKLCSKEMGFDKDGVYLIEKEK